MFFYTKFAGEAKNALSLAKLIFLFILALRGARFLA